MFIFILYSFCYYKTMIKQYLISILNIPGVMIHEFSHYLFCTISGVKVYEVCYFQFKNPIGYVKHQEPKNFIQSFLITMGPFILGTILSFVLFGYINMNPRISILNIVALWFGVVIAVHSFPSRGDGKVLFREANRHIFINKNPFAILLYPFVLILKIINFLRRYYLDFLYAIFLFGLTWYIIRIIR